MTIFFKNANTYRRVTLLTDVFVTLSLQLVPWITGNSHLPADLKISFLLDNID